MLLSRQVFERIGAQILDDGLDLEASAGETRSAFDQRLNQRPQFVVALAGGSRLGGGFSTLAGGRRFNGVTWGRGFIAGCGSTAAALLRDR